MNVAEIVNSPEFKNAVYEQFMSDKPTCPDEFEHVKLEFMNALRKEFSDVGANEDPTCI